MESNATKSRRPAHTYLTDVRDSPRTGIYS